MNEKGHDYRGDLNRRGGGRKRGFKRTKKWRILDQKRGQRKRSCNRRKKKEYGKKRKPKRGGTIRFKREEKTNW